MRRVLVAAMAVSGAAPAAAHPGHGVFAGWGPAHWLFSPPHLLALPLLLAVGLAVRQARRRHGAAARPHKGRRRGSEQDPRA